VEHARETLSLALEFKEKTGLVVGLDLSGDGTVRSSLNMIIFHLRMQIKLI